MSLKKQLEEKQIELKGLEADIKAENEEAIAKSEAIVAEIEAIEKRIKMAEKATSALSRIGTAAKEEASEGKKSLSEAIKEKESALAGLKAAKGSVSFHVKAYNDAEVIGDNKIITYDRNPVNLMVPLGARDLFGAENISGNALTYYVIGGLEGEIDGVAEGAEKNRIHIPYTPKTVALAKIAAYMKESDELLSDAAFLESAIRNRGAYEFRKSVENYLIDSLLDTSGVQTGGDTISFDNILAAKQDIFADTGYAPDALLINPADWATLLQTKDSNLQYLLGGPAFGSYGNGGYNGNPRIWGLNVVESAGVAQGQCLVGAFKAGASVITKAGEGLRMEVANTNEDDFIKNMVTVRIEERLVLAVRVPAAFETVGSAGGATGATGAS